MCINQHLQFEKQRKNALEILKQWEMESNLKNELQKNTYLTKIISAKCIEPNVGHIRHISYKKYAMDR